MIISLDSSENQFGTIYIVIATKDKYTKTLYREFYSYEDARALVLRLIEPKLDPDVLALFPVKRSR